MLENFVNKNKVQLSLKTIRDDVETKFQKSLNYDFFQQPKNAVTHIVVSKKFKKILF